MQTIREMKSFSAEDKEPVSTASNGDKEDGTIRTT